MVQNPHKQRGLCPNRPRGLYYANTCVRNKWTTLTWKNWQGLLSWLCSYLHILSVIRLLWNIGISCLGNLLRHPVGEGSFWIFNSGFNPPNRTACCGLKIRLQVTKKTEQGVTCNGGLRTYESPRKSWNLSRPTVVSASKLGNTSPSRRPGMIGSSLQRGNDGKEEE